MFFVAYVSLTSANCQSAVEYFNKGVSNNYLKNNKDAIADYTKSIEIDSNYARVFYSRANANYYLKNYREAIVDYNKSIKINPNYAKAYFNRGLSNIILEEKDRGCLDLSKAGELGLGKAFDSIKEYCN